MFMVLRKNSIILFACVVLILSGAVTLMLTRNEPEDLEAFALSASGRVVVIDAGHGDMG